MKFTDIYISHFGKFSDRTFRFSDGLNVLYGKNEAGKSTLAAYLKFMLYGFPTKGARNAEDNDKLHYMPWNGGAAAGSAEVATADGKHYRIERSCGAKNTVRVVELPSEKEVHFGKPVGEEWFGTDDKAFSRMAYIRERDISGDDFENLSENIQNIVFAADESVNIEKAQKKLRDYRNVYRTSRGTGKCHEWEEKIRSLRHDFDRAAETHKILLEAEAKLSELRANMRKNAEKAQLLEAELCEIDACRAEELLAAVLESKRALEHSKEAYDAAVKAVGTIDKNLPESVIAAAEKVREAEKTVHEIDIVCREAEEALENAEKEQVHTTRVGEEFSPEELLSDITKRRRGAKRFGTATWICAILSLLFAGILFGGGRFFPIPSVFDSTLAFVNVFSAGAALFAVLFLLFGIFFLCRKSAVTGQLKEAGFSNLAALHAVCAADPAVREKIDTLRKKAEQYRNDLASARQTQERAREELERILERAGGNAENPYEFAERVREKLSILSNAENDYHRCKSAYEAYLTSCDLHALTETAGKKRGIPTRERTIVEREAEFCKKAGEALAEKEKDYIKAAAAPSSTLRKPAEILAERTATEACLAEAEQKVDALELAMNSLTDACEELRCGVSPRIAARAGELFRKFTGNDDDALSLSSEFSLSAWRDGTYRENGKLSAGTSDAAYLAVRIALCETLFAEDPILVLDESFAYMDEERMKNTLSVLSELSERFQIFVFTCHESIADAAKSIANAHTIALS